MAGADGFDSMCMHAVAVSPIVRLVLLGVVGVVGAPGGPAREEFPKNIECKVGPTIGTGPNEAKSGVFLKREFGVDPVKGWGYEADRQYI